MPKREGLEPKQEIGKRIRGKVLLVVRCGISVGLMYLALRHVNWISVSPLLRSIKGGWVVAAILVLVAQFIVTSLRWKLVLWASGVAISLPATIRLIFIAAFFNQTLPGTFGGDAARVMLLRGAGNQWSSSVNSVVIDRAVGGAALGALVLACYPGTANYLLHWNDRIALVGISSACLMAFLAILTIGSLPTPWRLTRQVLSNLNPISRIVFRSFSDPAGLLTVIFLSISIHLLSTCSVWCLAKALSVDLSVTQALFLIPPVLLVSTIPVSIAGWGLRENAMVSLLGYAGINAARGLLVSILFGLLLIALGGIGGVIWMMTPAKRPTN